jgi:hypothetical protein
VDHFLANFEGILEIFVVGWTYLNSHFEHASDTLRVFFNPTHQFEFNLLPRFLKVMLVERVGLPPFGTHF